MYEKHTSGRHYVRWIDIVGKIYERYHVHSEEEGKGHQAEEAGDMVLFRYNDYHDQRPDDDNEC